MSLTKRVYTDYDSSTPITAQNLNAIQQEIINTCSYVVCDTAANIQRKTVSLDDFTLVTGCAIRVRFSNTNTANNPILNVNQTGDKYIYSINGNPIGTTATTSWGAGYIVDLVYDGSRWVMLGYMPEIGNTASLETEVKSDLVSAINSLHGLITYEHSYGEDTDTGSYCKLPDGTLIQWISASITSGTEMEIIFPISFYDLMYCVGSSIEANGLGNSGYLNIRSMTKTLNSINFKFVTYPSGVSYEKASVIAVGRWK